MNTGWKHAALGALGGAALAVVIIIVIAAQGLLPGSSSDAKIHAYLMAHPSILVDMTNQLQADQAASEDNARQAAVDKLGQKAFFNPRVAFITGPANAKNTLVEFYDYDCPYCRASLPALKKFYQTHKNNTRFAFVESPIPSLHGPSAVLAARASLAARRQPDKFVAFYFTLMGEDGSLTDDIIYADAKKSGLDVDRLKKDMTDKSIDTELSAGRALGLAAKVDGTPAFIINGRIHEGSVDETSLNQLAKQHV
jgi:protein-disulfide isomerase